MAKTSMVVKNNRLKNKSPIQHRNRCSLCGRPRGYLRDFGLCRLCFRREAQDGNLPGVTKASW